VTKWRDAIEPLGRDDKALDRGRHPRFCWCLTAKTEDSDMTALYDTEDLKKLPKLGAGAPEAWKAFLAFDHAALADGAIPKKYKELMALAVALTTQCPYCLAIHKEAAAKAGATAEEIAETTFVAAALRAGAAITHGTHLVA
jgi:AhpD family alkylhydroperoxidase